MAFSIREQAVKEIGELGDLAEPSLRKVLESKPSFETGKRIENLLATPAVLRSPETLRRLRAVQVLELIGSVEAKEVLRKLAAGPASVRESQDAREALARLGSK